MKKPSEYDKIKILNSDYNYVNHLAEQVVEDAREIQIHTVAGMCDNRYRLTLKKNVEGDFVLHRNGEAYSNFGIKYDQYELEWAADARDFARVFEMINSGFQVVEKVRSRA